MAPASCLLPELYQEIRYHSVDAVHTVGLHHSQGIPRLGTHSLMRGCWAKWPQVCPGVRQHLYYLVQMTICPLSREEVLSLSFEVCFYNHP